MDHFKFILFIYNKKTFELIDSGKILSLLYENKACVPTKQLILENKKNTGVNILKLLTNEYLTKIKIEISKIDDKIPLYDIYNMDIYLINKENVYTRVINDHYRITDNELYSMLVDQYNRLKEKKIEDNINIKYILTKFKKNISFLNNFDIDTLKQRYINVMYYSDDVGRDLTICIKPSFIPYIIYSNPYYSAREIKCMGLNMGLIKLNDKKIPTDLCKKIRENDIHSKTLIEHQKYIEYSNGKYLVEMFSMYGSYFMNKYMRNLTNSEVKELRLEKLIHNMNNLVSNAPKFSKSYYLYRFVSNDTFLQKLKVGDIFIDKGFISSTRNPFYDIEKNIFGLVLLKIKIPKNTVGVALSIETYSFFGSEQELILPPFSHLKLISINNDYTYYHTNVEQSKLINKKYEFEYIGKDKIRFDGTYLQPSEIPIIDLMNVQIVGDSIEDKINFFYQELTNSLHQFYIIINNEKVLFHARYYDSSGPYEQFYFIKSNNGLFIYNQNENNNKINISFEIGEIISVNFYDHLTDSSINFITDDLLLNLSSKIGYAFQINSIYIHPYYSSYKNIIDRKKGIDTDIKFYNINDYSYDITNYCNDIYQYLKNGTTRFSEEDQMIFSDTLNLQKLDRLTKTKPLDILSKTDKNELYNIYMNVYTQHYSKENDNLKDFYLFIIENFFYYVKFLEQKMDVLYNDRTNPFIRRYYVLETYTYLYEKNIIQFLPYIKTKFLMDDKINIRKKIDMVKVKRDIYHRIQV